MIKNFFLLGLLCWVCVSQAKEPIVQESLGDADSYKVDKGEPEQEAQRSVAGEKIKKNKTGEKESYKATPTGEPGSEVRYWQFQE